MLATGLRAFYRNPSGSGLTKCVTAPAHDAARYTGRLVVAPGRRDAQRAQHPVERRQLTAADEPVTAGGDHDVQAHRPPGGGEELLGPLLAGADVGELARRRTRSGRAGAGSARAAYSPRPGSRPAPGRYSTSAMKAEPCGIWSVLRSPNSPSPSARRKSPACRVALPPARAKMRPLHRGGSVTSMPCAPELHDRPGHAGRAQRPPPARQPRRAPPPLRRAAVARAGPSVAGACARRPPAAA